MAHEKDAATNNYISDPIRFADLYNGSLFKGKKVIHPEDLVELHNSMNVLVPDNKNHIKSERRYRDIVKKSFSSTQFLVLACENQYEVHYAMVVRNMLYDSLNYTQQVENLCRGHRQRNDIKNSAEFLSGITKTDRLAPVITLVVYFGDKPWDAGLQLYDLIDFSPNMEELKPYISSPKHCEIYQSKGRHLYIH